MNKAADLGLPSVTLLFKFNDYMSDSNPMFFFAWKFNRQPPG
ncbi:hypothetical protein [Polyangium jinanense]|nr:hypothetical protein [Polyangium jinanense]